MTKRLPPDVIRQPGGIPKVPFDPSIGEQIIEGLKNGKSLLKLMEEHPEWPSRSTILKWEDENPEFETAVWKARKSQAALFVDRLNETIENSTPETSSADNVKIKGYTWLAARMAPRKYGDKLALTGGDEDDAPIKNELTIKFVKGS